MHKSNGLDLLEEENDDSCETSVCVIHYLLKL